MFCCFYYERIYRHQKKIIFSDKIERIFCYVALIQFLSSTLVICCLRFMIVTVNNRSPKLERNDRFTAVAIYIAVQYCNRSIARH